MWCATSRMASAPVTPGVFMPDVGNHPSPDAKTTMRMSPSQRLGTDQRVSATPVCTRSEVLPCFHAPCTPSHRPSAIETARLAPTSSSVGPRRSPTIDSTGRLYWNDSPKSKRSTPSR